MTTGQEAARQSTAPIERVSGSRELMWLRLSSVKAKSSVPLTCLHDGTIHEHFTTARHLLHPCRRRVFAERGHRAPVWERRLSDAQRCLSSTSRIDIPPVSGHMRHSSLELMFRTSPTTLMTSTSWRDCAVRLGDPLASGAYGPRRASTRKVSRPALPACLGSNARRTRERPDQGPPPALADRPWPRRWPPWGRTYV